MRREIQRLTAAIEELPTLPSMIGSVLQVTEDERSSAKDLERLISRDYAISSKVLKMANSAFFGFSGRISSIQRAIILLGFNLVKSLTLSIPVLEIISQKSNGSAYVDWNRFWLHTFSTALLARTIEERDPSLKGTNAFFLGLLHDLGKPLLILFAEDRYEDVVRSVDWNRSSTFEAERSSLGIDHAEAGMMLARRWKLPEALIEAISFHHQPKRCGPTSNRRSVALVHLADILSRKVGMDDGISEVTPEPDREAISWLRLVDTGFTELIDRFEGKKDQMQEFLQILRTKG